MSSRVSGSLGAKGPSGRRATTPFGARRWAGRRDGWLAMSVKICAAAGAAIKTTAAITAVARVQVFMAGAPPLHVVGGGTIVRQQLPSILGHVRVWCVPLGIALGTFYWVKPEIDDAGWRLHPVRR